MLSHPRMVATINGSALGNGADPHAIYLTRRDLAVLRTVRAVDADQAAVMDRADKIGTGNKNELAEVNEVAALHRPDVNATLFPDEQRALGTVWERFRFDHGRFETPVVPVIDAGSFHSVPAQVGGVDPDRPFEIVQLPAALQKIARRVQLTIDADRAPPTIQYADLNHALVKENAEKYTQPELQQIDELRKLFLEELLPRQITPPKLEVPELGEHRFPLAALPGLGIELVTENTLSLSQSMSVHARSSRVHNGGVTDVSNDLMFERKAIAISFEVPADHRLVVITERGERVYEPGPAALPPEPGKYMIELYDAQGTKVGDSGFTMPKVEVQKNLSAEHAGKPVVADGRPLELQLASYRTGPIVNRAYGVREFMNGTAHAAEWKYVAQGTAHHNGDAAGATAALAWPGGELQEGTYRFVTDKLNYQSFETTLEKYPGPLFKATVNGAEYWLTPYGPSKYGDPKLNGRRLFQGVRETGDAATRSEVTFDPATSTLTITRNANARSGPVDWTHVVKDTDFDAARASA